MQTARAQDLASSEDLPIRIRPADPGDLPLIMDSWLRSYLGQRAFSGSPLEVIYPAMRALIVGLLQRHGTAVLVAEPDVGVDDVVAGWAAADRKTRVLWWISVKAAYRRQRVASRLLEATLGEVGRAPISAAMWSPAAAHRQARWRLVYSPHVMRP